MKKFLLFTLEYPPFHGGVANYYGHLIKYWPASAKNVAGEPETVEIDVLNNNSNKLLNTGLPLGWLKAAVKLWRYIKTNNITYVLVGQILPLGSAAYLVSKIIKIKYAVFLHGLDLSLAAKWPRKKWLAEKILKNSDKIICLNNFTADLTKRFFPGNTEKIVIVNPAVEPAPRPANEQISALKKQYNLHDKMVLLSVGRLVKRKGVDMVIKAMPKVLKKIPNLVYIILGDGEEKENLELEIKNSELDKNIKIITQSSDQERDSWYNLCDIFIMASRNIKGDFEGFGIVYLEANLAGKPVIAGRSGGVGDAVINDLNGLLVDPEDTGQIASAIIKLAENPDLRQKLGEQGKNRAIKDFNWQKQIIKIFNFINL